jgi:molybdopterin converting factor small subunit
MARLRLFARLREVTGTGSADVPGATVGEVLANAATYFGQAFSDELAYAQVWLNGERAGSSTVVDDDDEVSLVPIVVAGTEMVRSPAGIETALLLGATVLLFVGNALGVKWLAVAVVLAGVLWAYDLAGASGRRGLWLGALPVMLAVFASVLAAYRFGIPGMAVAAVGAALLTLIWSIFTPRVRPLESIATGVLISAVGALGAGSMILLRLRSEAEMTSFLVVVAVAVAVSWLVAGTGVAPIDPLTAGVLAALGAAVVAGAVWSEDLWPTVAAGAAAAVALVAGRNAGSLARSGALYAGGEVPGSLSHLDGVMLAAGAFWAVLRLVA